ncbi:precorrin-2 C(20)-methyltransferase [Clostridium aminobutyricum]|uniref:Cobalt-precorrin-2 C(20)-methyltransferase n=1 Tax=Clostridium aminobutyricum TaxID=33953 RepID=A0A939D704_CLOAM|nr:precorrin-2 C(20)-methyltransferase [Clostridium aminobutyricum]MBN7771903.1 precorrin-2 C(20)-methyltransferase [Clostridium aminobutyricum]
MATLYGLGVGPGDPELMTLKAVRLIQECDIIAVPKSGQSINVAYTIAKKAVPDFEQKHIVELDLPMTRDQQKLEQSHEAAAKQVTDWLDEGKNVAFLTLGDPTIYSTYAYIHKLVKGKGYPTEIVPGIPSFCAVSARLNDSLTEAEEELHVIPASYTGVEEALNLRGTKVLMKSGKSISEIKQLLKKKPDQFTVKMVERCGMEGERVFDSIDQIDENASYFSVIIVREKK